MLGSRSSYLIVRVLQTYFKAFLLSSLHDGRQVLIYMAGYALFVAETMRRFRSDHLFNGWRVGMKSRPDTPAENVNRGKALYRLEIRDSPACIARTGPELCSFRP